MRIIVMIILLVLAGCVRYPNHERIDPDDWIKQVKEKHYDD